MTVLEAEAVPGGSWHPRPAGDLSVSPGAPLLAINPERLAAQLDGFGAASAWTSLPLAGALGLVEHAGLRPIDLTRWQGMALVPRLGYFAQRWRATDRFDLPSLGSMSLERLAQRVLGTRATHRIVRPFVALAAGAHPSQLGAADAAPGWTAGLARRGGMRRAARRPLAAWPGGLGEVPALGAPTKGWHALTDQLATGLGEALRLGTRVERLVPARPGAPALLFTTSGGRHEADRIVLAVSAAEQAALLAPHDAQAAQGLLALPTTSQVRVVVEGVLRGPRTFALTDGVFARGSARMRCRGGRIAMLDRAAGRTRLELIYGGLEDPAVLDLSERALRVQVLRDIGCLGPVPFKVTGYGAWRREHAQPCFGLGHRRQVAEVASRCDALGIWLHGAHRCGLGVANALRGPYELAGSSSSAAPASWS